MRFQNDIWSVEVNGNERIETNDTRTKFFHNVETTGTYTGSSTAVGTAGMRKVHASTSAPSSSDGADGDLWIKY